MTISKILPVAALALAAGLGVQPASAQVAGIASADPTITIGATKAYGAANTLIGTTYKTNFDQINQRQTALNAQLQPMYKQLDKNGDGKLDQAELDAAEAAKSPVLNSISVAEKAGNAAMQQLSAPAVRAQAYAIEMITAAYPQALKNVVAAKKVSVVLSPEAFVYAPKEADITLLIAAEIDKSTPTVPIVPPANWQPNQQTLQVQETLQRIASYRVAAERAQQAGAPGVAPGVAPAAPAAVPAKPATDPGR